MGRQKSNQEDVPNPAAVVNRDLMQRMNFLYQVASHLSQESTVSTPEPRKNEDTPKRKRGKRKGVLKDLAAFHIKTMKIIAARSMVKMDPTVKRTICKTCNIVMVPGITSNNRIKGSSNHRFVRIQTCSSCGWTLKIPCPPYPTTEDETHGTSESMETDKLKSPQTTASNTKKERRAMRQPPLFERDGHLVYVATAANRNAAISSSDVRMER